MEPTNYRTNLCSDIKKNTLPYIKESIIAFSISSIIIIFGIILLYSVAEYEFYKVLLFIIIPLTSIYFIIEYAFNYRLGVLAYIDKRNNDFITAKLTILNIEKDYSLSSKNGDLVSKFYPKNMGVMRYKIITQDEYGKKVTIRAVMSKRT